MIDPDKIELIVRKHEEDLAWIKKEIIKNMKPMQNDGFRDDPIFENVKEWGGEVQGIKNRLETCYNGRIQKIGIQQNPNNKALHIQFGNTSDLSNETKILWEYKYRIESIRSFTLDDFTIRCVR